MQTKQQHNQKKAAGKFVPPEEHKALLSELSGLIAAVRMRDTRHALEVGHHLFRAKTVLPEKSYGKWVKQEFGMTTRNAWNFTVCIEVFSERQQEQLIAFAVKHTVMTTLATMQGEKVAEVIGRIKAGETFTVAQMKLLAKGDVPVKAPAEIGGTAGLLRAAQAKLKAESDMFNKLSKLVLKAVEQIVADLEKGKHVPKTRLADAVERHCQTASDLLSSVIQPVQSVATMPAEWEKARQIIARLGDSPRWPGKTEFADWVVDQVLPALRFVVHGRPTPVTEGEPEPVVAETEASDVTDVGEGEVETIDDALLSSLAEVVKTAPRSRLHIVTPPPLLSSDPVEAPETEEVTGD